MCRFPAFLISTALLFLGCASSDVGVSVTVDPLVRFPEQATFLLDRERSFVPNDPRLEALELDEVLEKTLTEAFKAHGYRLVSQPPVDYRMVYRSSVQEIIAADASRSIGSFWIDLFDAKTDRKVWTGAGHGPLYVGFSREEREANIREHLDRLLESFPPSQRPE
ncbi:MAG: DUF4136 domain-containing protein [bacterium]|nr:DUF4136 domain-containing protein [bacterium]